MAVQDFLGTFLVVAESRGRATLAGVLDATGDLVKYALTTLIAWAFLRNGDGIITLCAAATTSFFSTRAATSLAAKLLPSTSTPNEN
jgi:hypothetical protein